MFCYLRSKNHFLQVFRVQVLFKCKYFLYLENALKFWNEEIPHQESRWVIYASLGNVLSLSNKKEYLIGMKTFSYWKKLNYGIRVIAIKVRNLIEVKQLLSVVFKQCIHYLSEFRKTIRVKAKGVKYKWCVSSACWSEDLCVIGK